MKYSHIIGVDISKAHLDIALMNAQNDVQLARCPNLEAEIVTLLKELSLCPQHTLICAEYTGMYSYNLLQAADALGIDLWLEHPAQIKASTGIQRGKNDPLDAQRIAEYARRFRDRVRLVGESNPVLEQMRLLISERRLMVSNRATYKAQLSDQGLHMSKELFAQKAQRLLALIAVFDQQIAQVEQHIEQLIIQDPVLEQQYQLLQTVPGVGPRLAVYMLVSTYGFTRITNARKLCCHAGVAPFVYHSGINTHTRARISHRADKQLKRLLHLAALSVVARPGELRTYYQRKVEEGKPKMSVINAVRSKLVHRMFSVIKRQEPYALNY